MNFPRLKVKISAARHQLFVRGLAGIAPYYVVNEFPKSGGTWLAQMLADALDLPFRRHTPIQYEPSVTHGHFLRPHGLRNVVIMWRDPRDILVSFYYHCFFVNEHNNALLVHLMKRRCPFRDYSDIRSNLPTFIKFVTKTPITPSFSWRDFATSWADREDVVHTSYESLRADTPSEISRIVSDLTGKTLTNSEAAQVTDRHSFVRAKGRASLSTDVEMSFVREGSVGGWERHFSSQAMDVFEEEGYQAAMPLLRTQ